MCIQGIVYKIIHLDSEIQYVGSTCDSISGRWRTHKNQYKNWLNNKENNRCIAIYPYFEQYGIDRYKMILIKSYQVVDKKHLHVFEQLAINKNRCVNQVAAISLIGSYSMAKHFSILRSDKDKQYHQANKQSILERHKLYRQSNKQKIKEKAAIKIQCECGSIVCKAALTKHRKSAKCIAALAALTN